MKETVKVTRRKSLFNMQNYSDQIKGHEKGREYSTHRKFMESHISLIRKAKEEAHLLNLDVGGRLI